MNYLPVPLASLSYARRFYRSSSVVLTLTINDLAVTVEPPSLPCDKTLLTSFFNQGQLHDCVPLFERNAVALIL
jgi:hypothetical protein